jgi:hypothetical protein
MTVEQVWPSMKLKIQERAKKSKTENEYLIATTIGNSLNRVRLFDDYLERKPEGSRNWQTITREDVMGFAKPAMAEGMYSIKDPELAKVHGFIGSIVCSLLALLDEFEYKQEGDDRFLQYKSR